MTKPSKDLTRGEGTSMELADQPVPVGEIVLFSTDDGRNRVECRFTSDTVWLTQALLAELYGKDVRTINEHLSNLFDEGELDPAATIRKFRIVRREGLRDVARVIEHYNLDAILAVGYRVRSPRGTQLRRWATERLSEYLVKGFTLDDQRLKHPPAPELGVVDHFDDLLERIRDIRSSEARMYLRVRELFALAADYDPAATATLGFFRVMQNKLHFAATGLTAAKLIVERADHAKPNMGLTSWRGGRVGKADVAVAKNYLKADEIGELNRVVAMWLDYAEDQTRRRKQIFLAHWEQKLDEWLRFNDRNVLPNAGAVSHQAAESKAGAEYDLFTARRREQLEERGALDALDALEATAKSLEAPRKVPERGRGPRSGG